MAIGPLQFVARLLSEGVSSTEGLRRYRAAGGAVRTQEWYRAWGEITREVANRALVTGADVRRRPVAEEITTRTSSRPGAYLYRGQVAVNRRLRDSAGRVVGYTTQWLPASVRTTRPLTYQRAIDEMEADAATGGDSYDYIVLGGMVTSVSDLVAEQAL